MQQSLCDHHSRHPYGTVLFDPGSRCHNSTDDADAKLCPCTKCTFAATKQFFLVARVHPAALSFLLHLQERQGVLQRQNRREFCSDGTGRCFSATERGVEVAAIQQEGLLQRRDKKEFSSDRTGGSFAATERKGFAATEREGFLQRQKSLPILAAAKVVKNL